MSGQTTFPVSALQNIANRLRIDSIRATTEAASGHPTSCMSAAEIMASLFFGEMRFDPKNPRHEHADRFVLSKGHAAPILYAAWAEAGAFDRAELLKLRRIDSDLEGHPTPRLPFVDVATGSLGQGLCAAIGIALNARRIGADSRTYVLMGDGESAEGSVWEAAQSAAYHHLDTPVRHHRRERARTEPRHAVGPPHGGVRHRAGAPSAGTPSSWTGTTSSRSARPTSEARATKGRPTMILARTEKGKGVSQVEGKDGWHGRPFKKGAEADAAIAEIEARFVQTDEVATVRPVAGPAPAPPARADYGRMPAPAYTLGDKVATREAYGTALAALGGIDPSVVALDADVGNSTYSNKFEKAHPERFYENFIAEQVMVGAAMGFAARGAIPFPSTFACFLSRASDFIRMAGISNVNVKLAGSHAGISIGEDGPSQMALEDLAMMRAVPNCTVLYPCDAVSAERLVVAMAATPGPAYMRTSRPGTPVIYPPSETFPVGGSKVLRRSDADVATVVAAGVTVFEALAAYETLKKDGIAIRVIDAYSVQPIDQATLVASGRATGGLIVTVEDHYAAGGLGDAVSEAVADEPIRVHRLAVREIPRSGRPAELLDRYGISAAHVVAAVTRLTKG